MQERWRFILKRLAEKESTRVAELAAECGCSEVTIRKDIKDMDERGLLIRTRGGALCSHGEEKGLLSNMKISLNKNTEQKKKIAVKAYDYIQDRDTIVIDDASTSFYLAEYIRKHEEKRLAVVTNSLLVGNELAGVRHVELYMVGGYVGGYVAATIGEEAVSNMKGFHADKAFIGTHGINFEAGLTSIAMPQMQMKQAILKATEEVYVLADSGKFKGGYLTVTCSIDAVDYIITDGDITQVNLSKAKEYGVNLVVA